MKLKNLFLLVSCLFAFVCCDDEADKYYDRPDWLEAPIYQVLEEQGRFTHFLECIDRTDYAKVLKGASLSTVFAPNDEAFAAYLKENSYSSVADIPDDKVKELVSYAIVYSKWPMEHLADSFEDGQYVTGSFKRKTNCYGGPYRDPEFENNWVVDETSRYGFSYTLINYQVNLTSQNYKFLPVYSSAYFNSFPEPLQASDYNNFFPNSTYTGRNVQAGTILAEDILAENGIIHEVSMVNVPLENIETQLKEPEFQKVKSLLDYRSPITGEPVFKGYVELPNALLETFQKRLPHEAIDKIYFKGYTTGLAISPVGENVYNNETGINETEKSGNTLFVPTNDVLDDFIQKRLLKYYKSIDLLSTEVLGTLLNAHMVNGLVWPSQYAGSLNSTGEFINGLGLQGNDFLNDGILDSRIASNGFIYQIDHVIKSRYFETVYAGIYLNPDYLLLNRAYKKFYSVGLMEDLMKSPLNGYTSERYTMLNFSDKLLTEDGFLYDNINNSFSNSEMAVGSADERLKRLMRMHIFPGLKNKEVDSEITDFSQSPIANYNGWGFLVNYYGDLIRYKNNQLQAAGNIEDGTLVTVEKIDDEYNNGYAFNVDRMLQYTPRETAAGEARFEELSLWQYLARARTQNPNVSTFVNYVERCLKNPDTDELDGVKADNYHTVLMVNNTAMNNAITRGYLKPLASLFDANGVVTDIEGVAQATAFINSHFLQGVVLPDDGLPHIYPVNPMSIDKTQTSTLYRINDEELEMTNQRTYVNVSKMVSGTNILLAFEPQDITLGSTTLVKAGFGTTTQMRVQRGMVVGSTLPDNFRSNRIACKAVLHEVNNFFTFTLQKP